MKKLKSLGLVGLLSGVMLFSSGCDIGVVFGDKAYTLEIEYRHPLTIELEREEPKVVITPPVNAEASNASETGYPSGRPANCNSPYG